MFLLNFGRPQLILVWRNWRRSHKGRERELSEPQASLSESTRMNARGSGYPVSRRTTLGDELYEGTGAKPKTVRTTTLPNGIFENRKPENSTNVSKSDYLNPDRFAYTSTPYIRDREYMHLWTEENITTRRSYGGVNPDHSKSSYVRRISLMALSHG